jgi:hypothetical protein
MAHHENRARLGPPCETLVFRYPWQDECLEQLPSEDRPIEQLGPYPRAAREEDAIVQWKWAVESNDVDMMRLLTAANLPTLRREFCRLFTQRFPTDHDNGCPAGQPPPATNCGQTLPRPRRIHSQNISRWKRRNQCVGPTKIDSWGGHSCRQPTSSRLLPVARALACSVGFSRRLQ